MRLSSSSTPSRIAAGLALSLLCGCHGDPAGLRVPDSLAATGVQRFLQLNDSVRGASGPPAIASAYAGIAGMLATQGRVTPVRLLVDGVEEDWLATAREVAFYHAPCPAGALCIASIDEPLESVVAWRRDDPSRVVQLTSTPYQGSIGDPASPYRFGPFSGPATLMYLDGRGGVFEAAAGTQSITLTHTDRDCAPAVDLGNVPRADVGSMDAKCTAATMRTAFSASVAPPALFSPAGNTAAGNHSFALAPTDVVGARLEISSCASCTWYNGYPATYLPPLNLRGPRVLFAQLRATMDTVATLTLDVWNPTGESTTVGFPGGQQYDFIVSTSFPSTIVWRWSTGQGFVDAPASRTLAPGQHWIVTERWHPTAKGSYNVRAVVTSDTHFADASTYLTVP